MSALIYVVTEESISVYTDTLVVNGLGEELGHTSKALYLPHLNAIICGTGIAGMADQFLLQANERQLEELIDLSHLGEEVLPNLFDWYLNLPAVNSTHISSTIYLFGFSPHTNKPLAFAHRSENNFKSTPIAKTPPTIGLKPTDGINMEILSIGDDSEAYQTMISQALGQNDVPDNTRVYIGGDMLKMHLTQKGMVAYKVAHLDGLLSKLNNDLDDH